MDFIQSLDTTSIIAIAAAAMIILLVLFAKAIQGLLKIAIIAAMIACILYFLREGGIL